MAITSNNTDVFAVTVAGGSTSTTLFDGAFGDGSDGDGNITGGTTTLTREWHYNNLTITGTGILKPRGHRIFVKGVLTIAVGGSINDDGIAGGTGISGGTALTNMSGVACLGAGSGAGGVGRTTSGGGSAGAASSNCSTNNVAAQPIGGVGGGVSAPPQTGGLAGLAPVPTVSQKWNLYRNGYIQWWCRRWWWCS